MIRRLHGRVMGARALLPLVACAVGSAACGAVERSDAVRAAPSSEQVAWDAVPPGEYLLYDAELVVREDPPPTDGELVDEWDAELQGEWRARFFDGDRVRVSIGSTSLRGRSRSRRLSCTREPLRFTTGELVIDVPVGGRVSLLGAGDGMLRVAPPWAELTMSSQLVDARTISLDACAAMTPPALASTVPARPQGAGACVFAGPQADVERAWLPRGAPIELGARRGEWVAITAYAFGARVRGWVPARALTEAPAGGDGRWVRTKVAERVGPLHVPAGTPGRVDPSCWRVGGCPDDVELVLAHEGRALTVRIPLSSVQVAPTSPPASPPLRRMFDDFVCVYPGAPPDGGDRPGSLLRQAIRRTIRDHLHAVRYCYEQRLAIRPRLAGRVMTSFVIGPTGRVDSVEVRGDRIDAYVRHCIARVVRAMRFPRPADGGVVGVNYPFILSVSD